jgi:NADPH:quinone reductase-like Zn-dependent oxidoreductase
MTATAPACSAIFACSTFITSMMTPPFSISASPTLSRNASAESFGAPFLLAPKSLYVTWPIRPTYTERREQLEAAAADLFDAIQHGVLDVGPARSYKLDDIVTAHRDLESRSITGAAVIYP